MVKALGAVGEAAEPFFHVLLQQINLSEIVGVTSQVIS
jgi:hypothetical protein